ncbi:thiopeptide-type bacteriocin biosynthesis protein [Streptomyces sp. NBC_00690]|uniref:thiopeptide-type bacteriocin biosynthesis protein n=1 Tax=Streptomyces sp. NBC_00690 TaxID=2975808 RepID=UPI002E293201|nr:thiopeptide-type bacteriocin biosynthesis protein [Streptomyces sp. NBC_00690]
MHSSAGKIERAIHAVLGGTPVSKAAADASLDVRRLEEAIDVYQSAGRAALDASTQPDWLQVYVQFRDWHTAEQSVITHLWPVFQQAEAEGTIAAWWFVRKFPCWRFRIRPGPSASVSAVQNLMTEEFDAMAAQGAADRWQESIYEPETYVLGGPAGIDIAHHLFHADSREILTYISRHSGQATLPLGRKELSLLLLSTLMRGAGQEWSEQGDIWHNVERRRPLAPNTPLNRLRAMKPDLLKLLALDVGRDSSLLKAGGPLADLSSWFEAFHSAGKQLGEAARTNYLERGIRDITERHVLFHWNRTGLPGPQQSAMARAARTTILGE